MKSYLTKWLPPRADFIRTMTAEEATLMAGHGAWLDTLLADGRVIAHGPVADPAGGYGVALWHLGDDEDIAALTAQDPLVQRGVGHYEHFPMLQLKARG